MQAVSERFWSSVLVGDDDECWPWTHSLANRGYGTFHPTRKTGTPAHRFAFRDSRGEIPAGYVIDHLCRNRACCNPNHLEAVTPAENIRRGETGKWQQTPYCKRGHRFTPENTAYTTGGTGGTRCRVCRACARIRDKKRRSKAA